MAKPIAKLVSMLTPKRRWAQFSLATLFVLVAVTAVPCTWLAWKMEHKRKEWAAVAEIERFGRCYVTYDWREGGKLEPPGPSWIRRLLGDDFFAEVVLVHLDFEAQLVPLELEGSYRETLNIHQDSGQQDAVVKHLEQFAQLHTLRMPGTKVSDAGLRSIDGLTRLEVLELAHTSLTDLGLKHLARLTRLRDLRISGTQITDAGLKHLEGLTSLERLDLFQTSVTDAGVKHFAGLTRLRDLDIGGTQITDAGLEHLARLTQLQRLTVWGRVTDGGVAKLNKVLPNCAIFLEPQP